MKVRSQSLASAIVVGVALAAPACGGGETQGATRADLVQEGAAEVRERGCASCHQPPDARDGVLSGQTTPLPGTTLYGPNLTPDPDTGLGAWTDAQILRALRAGIDDAGDPLCATMPHFGVDDGDGRAIVAYLRSLPPVRHRIPASRCR